MEGMADERESKELQSGTLVIGLGRFGSAVAVTQDQLGYEILAVEKNPARVQAFAGRFPLVEADATSKDALEQLGAREFRSAVVGVGSSLEAAVLITANLVDMGISSIWVKATSSQHAVSCAAWERIMLSTRIWMLVSARRTWWVAAWLTTSRWRRMVSRS